MHGVSVMPKGPDGMSEFRRAYQQVIGIVSRNRKQAHLSVRQSLGQTGEYADGIERKWPVHLQRMPAYRTGSTLRRLLLTTDDRELVIGSRYSEELRGF